MCSKLCKCDADVYLIWHYDIGYGLFVRFVICIKLFSLLLIHLFLISYKYISFYKVSFTNYDMVYITWDT